MATKKEDFEVAFKILSQFERQLIPAEEFGWEYITSRVKPSKPTLWRNIEFRDEFNRVKKLVRAYKEGKAMYDLTSSKESNKDAEIAKLKRRVEELKDKLSKERERLSYASMIARRHNIDPIKFMEDSPLLAAIKMGKKNG